MLRCEINGSDRSADMSANSLSISNQLQARVDTARFNIFQNTKPQENQDVKIYKYTSIESAIVDDDLRLFTKLNGNSQDISSNNNHGVDTSVNYVASESGQAAEFDGASGNILFADNASIQNIFDGGGSISFTIKANSIGETSGRILDKTQSATNGHLLELANSDGAKCQLVILQYFSGTNFTVRTAARDIVFGETYHCVITYDNSLGTNRPIFYINNSVATLSAGTDGTGTRNSDVGNDLYIGNRSADDRTFDGYIDNFRIFNRILTPDEVSILYNYPSINYPVVLKNYFQNDVGYFYEGQKLHVRIGESDEAQHVVQSYDEDNLILGLETGFNGSISEDDLIGELIFGGTVSRVKDYNVDVLENLEYEIECTDYKKIFDKKLVSDSWADRDSRYIINGFVNTDVNYNQTIDDMDYANATAIRAEWIETNDGDNPNVDTSDYIEGDASGILPWTNSGGTANFTASPDSLDISDLVGIASGVAVEGNLMLWLKCSDYTKITDISIRIGSSASDYAELTFDVPNNNNWNYLSSKFVNASITGTPDYTAIDYLSVIVSETGDANIRINGIRVNAENSFSLYNVQSTPLIDDYRASLIKPSAIMQVLSKTWEYIWFVDYDRDIHFISNNYDVSPFSITDSSDNFTDLSIEIDQSQLGNRVTVIGGEETSLTDYSEVKPGDNATREWKMKGKYANMSITIDDNSDQHAAEAGTTTTNIKITGHGLSTGDHIVNRSRTDAEGRYYVREITKLDDDNFTVDAVPSQTTSDTISFFSTAASFGTEGLVDESTVDYVGNSNAQSVRASTQTSTLTQVDFIRFNYYERVDVQVQYPDSSSILALKNLGLGDGIFDLDPIIDNKIDTREQAVLIAQTKVSEYSNPTIEGSFKTEQQGLKAGQILTINETNRSINDDYVIQKVGIKQRSGEFNDNFQYSVNFGTTLFGWIEFMQKLLAIQDKIEINQDAIVVTFVLIDEIVECSDTNTTIIKTTGTWQFEPSVGQPTEKRFNLADFG